MPNLEELIENFVNGNCLETYVR